MSLPAQSQSRISCPRADCLARFARTSEMLRHLTEFHQPKKQCLHPGCSYPGAKRAGRVRKHMLREHPQLFNVPLQANSVPQFDLRTYPSFTQFVGTIQHDSTANKQVVNLTFGEENSREPHHPQNLTSQRIVPSKPRPHQSPQSPRGMLGEASDFYGWVEHKHRHTYGAFNGTNHAQAWDKESKQS